MQEVVTVNDLADINRHIEDLKRAYRQGNRQYFTSFEGNKILLKADNHVCELAQDTDEYQKASKAYQLLTNLHRYLLAAFELQRTSSDKEEVNRKFEEIESHMVFIDFNDAELLRHIKEAPVSPIGQKHLSNAREFGTIFTSFDQVIDNNVVFGFNSKSDAVFLLNEPAIIKHLQENLKYHSFENMLPRNAQESYICFIYGYLYEVGCSKLGVTVDLEKSKQFYEKACTPLVSKDGFDLSHSGALLLKAETLRASEPGNALRIYDQVIRMQSPETDIRRKYYSENYFTANLEAGKLCLSLKHIEKAKAYFEKALNHCPIRDIRVEAAKSLLKIARAEQNNGQTVVLIRQLEDLGITGGKYNSYLGYEQEKGSAATLLTQHRLSSNTSSADSAVQSLVQNANNYQQVRR